MDTKNLEYDDHLDHISASEDEDNDDERKHSQLLDAISSLDGKKKHRLSQRTVPTSQISEFNFSTSGGKAKVKLHELVGTLKDSVSHGELKKHLRTVEKRNKVVSVPLSKLEKERIDRSIAYTSTSNELKKWDPVVEQNRKAEQIIFPLQQPSLKLYTTDQVVQRFKPTTPLEMEVAALLQGSQHVHSKKKELTPAEEKAMKAMSLQEAKERRAELQKYRALLSYKEAKARWQKKIKSKRYHRVLRKERLKNEKKALEELQKTDPEAYLEKLNSVKQRHIQERMSLKHRGGSKFAKKQMIYSKFDDQARQAVQDMLQKSKDLTQKIDIESDSDDDGVREESDDDGSKTVHNELHVSSNNPWMKVGKIHRPQSSIYKSPEPVQNKDCDNTDDAITENVDDDESLVRIDKNDEIPETKDDYDYDEEDASKSDHIEEIFHQIDRKSENKKAKSKSQKSQESKVERKFISPKGVKKSEKNEIDNNNEGDYDDEDDDLISESLTRKKTLEDIENDNFSEDEEVRIVKSNKKENLFTENKEKKKVTDADVYVDPKKIFTLESKLKHSAAPGVVVDDDDDDGGEPDEEQRMTIAQAFADDDVIDEFRQEKKGILDRDKPKDIDLTLPGWGDWGGTGIKMSKKKKKRFTIKAPPPAPRKDKKLGNVIISELKDTSIRKHQVNELPFPYANVKQFEQSIRAPIGKTWNPETAYKQLVKPNVVTRLGTVIEPIDKSEVFKKQKVAGKRKPDFSFDTTDDGKKKKNETHKGKWKSKGKKKQKS